MSALETVKSGTSGGTALRQLPRLTVAIVVLVGACSVSLAYAFTSQPIFERINAVVHSQDPITRQVEFLAFPLLLAASSVIWGRRFFGWQVGMTVERWRLVAVLTVVVAAAAVGLLILIGATPYSGFPWPEWTLVPLAEEAVYRGILLAVIVLLLSRGGFGTGSRYLVLLAVSINALAFGFGHAANFQYNPPLFTAMQIGFASALGAVLAYAEVKTNSMIAPIVLHALVNLIAVVM